MNARPPIWIGPRGIAALVGLALVAGACTIVLPWPVVVGAAAIIALAALAADAGSIGAAPVIARLLPAQLTLARRTAFEYTIVNRAPVALRFAIFEAPVERVAVDPAPATGTVAGAASATVSIGVLPRERGRTQTGVGFAWFESPLGLVRRRLRVGTVDPLRVRPDLSAIERGGDLAQRTRLIDAGLRRVRRRGSGTEFESLREYTSGDPFRAIDWNATARRGKIMVAQYEVERSQQIVIALDAGRLMSPRLGDRRKLDYSVSAALAIASLARIAADRVGFHAFAGTTLASIAPGAGAQHAAALTEALSDLEPRFEESDYERAALELRRRYRKRSLIVIFTDLFDPIASSAVLASLALLAPHHLVLVVLMNDAALTDAREREPANVQDVYRASVATALDAERARAVSLLRGRGIGVIDVPARELSIALLEAYVDVKTRALL
jgi:uncharacterized protein (DUF58 family)